MSVDDSGLDGLFRSGTYTEESGVKPEIFPDYADVTIPPNIAPLNFKLKDACAEARAILECGGEIRRSRPGKTLVS